MQALVIAGISLQAANLYGYVLCKMGSESNISKVTASFLSQTVFQTVSYSSLTPGPLISRHLEVLEACWQWQFMMVFCISQAASVSWVFVCGLWLKCAQQNLPF